MFHLFAYILLLYAVIKKKKAAFQEETQALLRHKNQLIVMTRMIVKGEKAS